MIKYRKKEVELVKWLIKDKVVQIEFKSGQEKGSRICANLEELEGEWKKEVKKLKDE